MIIMAKSKPDTKSSSTKNDKRISPPGGYNGNRRRYGDGGKIK